MKNPMILVYIGLLLLGVFVAGELITNLLDLTTYGHFDLWVEYGCPIALLSLALILVGVLLENAKSGPHP